jgi:hypothetical protein
MLAHGIDHLVVAGERAEQPARTRWQTSARGVDVRLI